MPLPLPLGEVSPQVTERAHAVSTVAKVSGAMRKLPAVLLAERALPLPTQKAPLPCAESGAFFNLFLAGCGKPGAVLVLLIGGDHDLQPAHVRLQHFGDGHAAIGLQMVLQEGDQHTRGCHAGVVQGCLLYTSDAADD